ncbi:hypothetical protein D8674_013269 [Pyrus ussuriensis x Pyrus communis]|uniref:Uncharacterized protein n=1 Tax=Pyrus ussuriensis x Pyrus communis TaxID=2448454 RepID=A0A5N5GW76_9ROSA|nr:hypothetical protein D8674_013269 [Pyrus ussuriensis x Pyrus communis]
MDDKIRDQSVPANLYDLGQYVEFAHAIGVAMHNNCPTTEWCSWKYVPVDVKKAAMDELLCKYTLDDDTNEELMQLMKAALQGGYKRWREDVEQNGGPSK